jgi:hypothetical protein
MLPRNTNKQFAFPKAILKHLNTAQGTQILILVLLFFELQSEMQVAQCETEKFFNSS